LPSCQAISTPEFIWDEFSLPGENMEPTTRKVVQRSPAHSVRLIHLPHLQTDPIEADSSLERDFVHVAALCPFLHSIKHQPFKVVLGDNKYTPDFLLTFNDTSRLVVEVKPAKKLANYTDIFARASKKLSDSGVGFLIVDDDNIRRDGRTERALQIRRYAKSAFSQASKAHAMKIASGSADGLLIESFVSDPAISKALIFHLISTHKLECISTFQFDRGARVSIPKPQLKEASHAVQFTDWFNA
jgi:hypothetical protein